jgi:hypothetical protein
VERAGVVDGGEGNADQICLASGYHVPYGMFHVIQEDVQQTHLNCIGVLVGVYRGEEESSMD